LQLGKAPGNWFPVWRGLKRAKAFWFFFSKKEQGFFLQKEAKTFIRWVRLHQAIPVLW
jgi:hypothetical protein